MVHLTNAEWIKSQRCMTPQVGWMGSWQDSPRTSLGPLSLPSMTQEKRQAKLGASLTSGLAFSIGKGTLDADFGSTIGLRSTGPKKRVHFFTAHWHTCAGYLRESLKTVVFRQVSCVIQMGIETKGHEKAKGSCHTRPFWTSSSWVILRPWGLT